MVMYTVYLMLSVTSDRVDTLLLLLLSHPTITVPLPVITTTAINNSNGSNDIRRKNADRYTRK